MRSTLLRENSIDNGGEATKKIEQLAQQAKELILRQEQIDEQVTQR
jgi:outer membrane murein-binding lipoprotein Lpp